MSDTPIKIITSLPIENNGILIISFDGELDATNVDKTFSLIYDKLGNCENIKMIFDFKELKYFNSKAIGYIADVFSRLEEYESNMCICNCSEEIEDVLELVGITAIIETVKTTKEAERYLYKN